jgi:hypothetical protein
MPIIALGALAVGGSIFGGIMANKGANAQAKAVQDASAASVAEQRRQFDLNRGDLKPFMDNGAGANNKLAYLLGVGPQNPGAVPQSGSAYGGGQQFSGGSPRDMSQYGGSGNRLAQYGMARGVDGEVQYDSGYQPATSATAAPSSDMGFDPQGGYGSLLKDFSLSDFTADPGYNFRLSEGAKALERSSAARGLLNSGGFAKGLTDYNQNFASNEFNNAYNRFNTNKLNRYNMLSGLSAGGQQATNTAVQAGTSSANNISNILMNAGEQVGNARASGYAGWGQAVNGGIGNALGLYYATKK